MLAHATKRAKTESARLIICCCEAGPIYATMDRGTKEKDVPRGTAGRIYGRDAPAEIAGAGFDRAERYVVRMPAAGDGMVT